MIGFKEKKEKGGEWEIGIIEFKVIKYSWLKQKLKYLK
jgi:hypothetical protein